MKKLMKITKNPITWITFVVLCIVLLAMWLFGCFKPKRK